MNKFKDLIKELKAHPPKFLIGDTAYTVYRGEVVKCSIDSVNIEWDAEGVSYTYTLYTENDDKEDYDIFYGNDNDTFADEASAKRVLRVPQLEEEIRWCNGHIDNHQCELNQLHKLTQEYIEARIKELEDDIAKEKNALVEKEAQLKELKENGD